MFFYIAFGSRSLLTSPTVPLSSSASHSVFLSPTFFAPYSLRFFLLLFLPLTIIFSLQFFLTSFLPASPPPHISSSECNQNTFFSIFPLSLFALSSSLVPFPSNLILYLMPNYSFSPPILPLSPLSFALYTTFTSLSCYHLSFSRSLFLSFFSLPSVLLLMS